MESDFFLQKRKMVNKNVLVTWAQRISLNACAAVNLAILGLLAMDND